MEYSCGTCGPQGVVGAVCLVKFAGLKACQGKNKK